MERPQFFGEPTVPIPSPVPVLPDTCGLALPAPAGVPSGPRTILDDAIPFAPEVR